jgi:hypothetical protein
VQGQQLDENDRPANNDEDDPRHAGNSGVRNLGMTPNPSNPIFLRGIGQFVVLMAHRARAY